MKMKTVNINTMTTLDKIQAVLTPMQIRKIKVDFEFIKEEYEAQNINSSSFKQKTEMVSFNTRKNLEFIQSETWKMFGGSGMVMINQAIEELCGNFELNMYK